MKRVVMESPFGATDPDIVEANIAYAKRCLHDSLTRGEAPIASHLLFTQPGVLRDNEPLERELGISAGLAWHHACHLIAFYVDRGFSQGMERAYDHALGCYVPIEFRTIDNSPVSFNIIDLKERYRLCQTSSGQ